MRGEEYPGKEVKFFSAVYLGAQLYYSEPWVTRLQLSLVMCSELFFALSEEEHSVSFDRFIHNPSSSYDVGVSLPVSE